MKSIGSTSQRRSVQLAIDGTEWARETHYLFRYPAKFHPPVARSLLSRFTRPGERVYDPFCGSGTLMLEAVLAKRRAVGSDVDPLAVFISEAKTRPIPGQALRKTYDRLRSRVELQARDATEYERFQWTDISEERYLEEIAGLWVPPLPNMFHWFRRYVVVDLARIFTCVRRGSMPQSHRQFFLLCAASIIRNASNADPVPVSGLEVTSHMRKKDEAGRVINPFEMFSRATLRAITDMEGYAGKVKSSATPRVVRADATDLRGAVRGPIDTVITSPPYHGAVDYYRRHKLETYWLRLTTSQEERLDLLQQYIGRSKVPQRHRLLRNTTESVPGWEWLERAMRDADKERANAFRHYCVTMRMVFGQLSRVLSDRGRVVMVVGHSTWNGISLDTSRLFETLATPGFKLAEYLSYPVRNRYMSYSRHNGASIDREYVLVFRQT
jgi:tRNA G10  N-methylase Trm11